MTSFSFIFGVLPLAISTGAGANSRIAIGTSVIGGMLTATLLAIFYIPLFFVLVRRGVRDGIGQLRERASRSRRARRRHEQAAPAFLRPARRRAARRWSRTMSRPIRAVPASWPAGDAVSRARPKPRCRRHLPAGVPRSRLQTLIAQALVNNRDLMIAAANIAAAREQYRIQRADQLPQFNAAGGVTLQRRQGRCGQGRLSGRAAGPELRARPLRPAALADPGPARTLPRDRGRRPLDPAGAGRRHRLGLARLCRGPEPAAGRAADRRPPPRRACA